MKNSRNGIMATNNKKRVHGRYGRFWGLIGKNDRIDKDELVSQFTDGRTTHLHEMTKDEYEEMCDTIAERRLQDRNSYRERIRKARSSVLLRVGRLGINTVDNWDEVNAFLLSPKIAGKLLYEMDLDELKELTRKLEAIIRKGGIKSLKEEQKAEEDAKARQELTDMIINPNKATDTKPKYLS